MRKAKRNWNTGPRLVGGGYDGKILDFTECHKGRKLSSLLGMEIQNLQEKAFKPGRPDRSSQPMNQ